MHHSFISNKMKINYLLFVFIVFVFSRGVMAQSNLIVTPSSKIVVTDNSVLLVQGPISNAGSITIESGSSLIQTHSGTDQNTTTGTYYIKRTGHTSNLAYNAWSSPIQAANIISTFSPNPCDVYAFKASIQEWKYDYTVGFNTTCLGNPVTFNAFHLISPDGVADGIMDPMRGYFIPGTSSGTPAGTRTFTGTVNNGDLSTTIWSTNITSTLWGGTKWNLVGNPYPSAIDLNAFWTANTNSGAISDGVYFWMSSATQPYNDCSDYYIWNPTGTVTGATCLNAPPPLPVLTSYTYASSGQGFWVYAAGSPGTTATVTFDNSMRSVGTNSNFYKRAPGFERMWLTVTRNHRRSNQILLGLTNDATHGYDPYWDAHKIAGSSTIELAFILDSNLFAILAQPTLSYQDQEELPLYVVADSLGMYEFAIDSINNPSVTNYFLIDRDLGIVHNLSTPYEVRLSAGTYTERFYLLYTDVLKDVKSDAGEAISVIVFNSEDNIKLQVDNAMLKNLTLYNTVGALLWNKDNVNAPSYEIPVGEYATGVYFVKLELDNGHEETRKIVVR